MSALVDPETQRFAVISVHNDPGHERLVLAYRDEQSLRDCWAEASIVGLGYGSRDEALATIDKRRVALPSLEQNPRGGFADPVVHLWSRITGRSNTAGKSDSLRARAVVVQLLQHGFVLAILSIYSKNLFSATIRALVSF